MATGAAVSRTIVPVKGIMMIGAVMEDGSVVRLGQATYVNLLKKGNWIFTARHVIDGIAKSKGQPFFFVPADEGYRKFSFEIYDFVERGRDIAMMKAPNNFGAVCQTSAMPCAYLDPRAPVNVFTYVGFTQHRSTGNAPTAVTTLLGLDDELTEDTYLVRQRRFKSNYSSNPGDSGAPIVQHGKFVGVHCGAIPDENKNYFEIPFLGDVIAIKGVRSLSSTVTGGQESEIANFREYPEGCTELDYDDEWDLYKSGQKSWEPEEEDLAEDEDGYAMVIGYASKGFKQRAKRLVEDPDAPVGDDEKRERISKAIYLEAKRGGWSSRDVRDELRTRLRNAHLESSSIVLEKGEIPLFPRATSRTARKRGVHQSSPIQIDGNADLDNAADAWKRKHSSLAFGNPGKLNFSQSFRINSLTGDLSSELVELGRAKFRATYVKESEEEAEGEGQERGPVGFFLKHYYSRNYPKPDSETFKYYVQRNENLTATRRSLPFFSRDSQFNEFLEKFYMPVTPRVPEFNNLFEFTSFDDLSTWTLKHIVKVELFDSLEDSKSPGAPINFLQSTNGRLKALMEADFWNVVDERIRRLFALGKTLFDFLEARDDDPEAEFDLMVYFGYPMNALLTQWYPDVKQASEVLVVSRAKTARHLVLEGYTDPVLIVKKGEPRAVEAGVPKPPRLVCMVSAVTNTIQRVLYKDALMFEQSRRNIPTATALDITSPDGRASLFAQFAGRELASSDVQGWEWSCRADTHYRPMWRWVKEWGLMPASGKFRDVFVENRPRLYLMLAEAYCGAFRVVQTCDGKLYSTPPGHVSSGEFTTFSGGSLKRSSLAFDVAKEYSVELTYLKSAGDDNLKDSWVDMSEGYLRYGYKITDFVKQDASTGFDFCSTKFFSDRAYQENIDKFIAGCYFKYPEGCEDDGTGDVLMSQFYDLFASHPLYAEKAPMLNIGLSTGAWMEDDDEE